MKKVIRVFPRENSYTPDSGEYVHFGYPKRIFPLPEHDEIHISCVFTWDKAKALDMQYQWQAATEKPVIVGGVAFESPVCGFTPGMYIKEGIVFTSHGCNNECPWCVVPRVEGKLKELPILPGNVIQDNNFLQCNQTHKDRTFEMLKTQKSICFKGGLDARLLDEHFVEGIRDLSIKELWLACDTDAEIPAFKKACEKLIKAGFNREKIKCYALIGDNMNKNEARLREIYTAGAMPFAQLYRDFSETKTAYSGEWNAFARMWQRPAATIAHMEKGTDFRNFNT
jgi:hypothetical protein